MLYGEFVVSLGDKNRVAIPKLFRESMSEELFLTRGFEGSLIMFDKERLRNFENMINSKSLLSFERRQLSRFILGALQQIEYDNQGRFVVSESLKEFGKLEDKIVFSGIGEWIEIWSKEKFDTNFREIKGDLKKLSEKLVD